MAGHVPRRVLKQPDVEECLTAGTKLWRWDEGGDAGIMKLTFYADSNGFFLYARGDDKSKCYDSYIWDFSQISDVRPGKPPRDSKLMGGMGGGDSVDSIYLTLVYRREGIIGLDCINLFAGSPEVADRFKKAVNALTANMLHAHASPSHFLKKHYTKIGLHANGRGEINLKDVDRLMMIRYAPDNFINQWLGTFNIVKDSVDGSTKYILEADFTEDIFMKMFDQILNNRAQDLDVVFSLMQGKSHKSKGQLTKDDFHKFLNADQRDPRLNEILHPYTTKDHAAKLINRHEKGRRGDRLTSKGLLEYLLSEENNVLDMDHLNQTQDMTAPLTHYFINSSHNTYLTGHQLTGKSTVEMYIQALLLGCRCVELDCWPENDDIIITHGGTLCTKIYFKDVVEAINEFAFVTSEYPVILSIENHCKSKPKLIERMATIFKVTFGDKLVSEPLEDIPLEPGVPLPSPERLKGKILLKDKIKRGKGGEYGTLTRGGLTHVPETLDEVPEESPDRDTPTSNGSEVTELPAITVKPEKEIKSETTEPTDGDHGVNEDVASETTNETSDNGVKESTEEVKSEDSAEEVKEKEKTKRKNSTDPIPSYTDSPRGSRTSTGGGGGLRSSVRSQGSLDGDIAELNLAMIPRPSEVEALVGASPLRELLNYCTGITFEGFLAAEKLNCSFYMSSFSDEKNTNYIRSQPKEYVRYNIRQMSRVYPEGKRIASSNYMPQGHWDVGCQLVALNFQTPDLPMQLNYAKFEFNGNTGYILKPWVLRSERAQFSPFVIKKLEDIVPAKISIKVISGYFLTDRRGANCFVEVETYGLYADTIRRKHYTKKMPAPHPHWNESPFTFKQILLPELALLRVVVYNDDHEIVGQRSLPVNAIRPGFRHIPLRDKHNVPLPLSMLFVHIKVEDWVPADMGDLVAMLMDPIAYASAALKAMGEGLDEGEEDQPDTSEGKATPTVVSNPKDGVADISGTIVTTPIKNPTLERLTKSSVSSSDSLGFIPTQLPASGSSQNLQRDTLPGSEDTIPCIEEAKQRDLPPVTTHDNVLKHKDYLKVEAKAGKDRATLLKKQEKLIKTMREKIGKGKVIEESVKELERQQTQELAQFDKNLSTKLYEVKRKLLESAHKQERDNLVKKIHKKDFENLNAAILIKIKEQKKQSNEGDISLKDTMRGVEYKLVQLGKKVRTELEMVHQKEVSKIHDVQKTVIQDLVKAQAKELADFDAKYPSAGDTAGATSL